MSDECTAVQPRTVKAARPPEPTLAAKVAGWVLMVYVLGVVGAFFNFSWQYAKEHSFLSWLFSGELVPAGKSLISPYYPVSSLLEKGWTQDEKENLARWRRGMAATRKALILLEGFDQADSVTTTDATRVRALLKEALDESSLVREDVLAKVHPGLPKPYREKYLAALTRMVQLSTGRADAREYAIPERLLKEWQRWADEHKEEMRFPQDVLE